MIDVLLCVMALIWGTNYSIVKSAFREVDPQAFNAVRMAIASCVFLWVIAGLQLRRRRTGSDSFVERSRPGAASGPSW